jgi:hypothetical protein
VTTPLHPRRLLRDAIVATLTGATVAGSRVTKTRRQPSRIEELPEISVYTLEETVDEASADMAPRELTRSPRIAVVARVIDTDSVPVDDAMDAIALQIETAMAANRYLDGTAGGRGAILSTTEMVVESSENGDPIVGLIRLIYSATYYTLEVDPDPAVPFERVEATVQIAGSSPDNAPSEVFEIPQ